MEERDADVSGLFDNDGSILDGKLIKFFRERKTYIDVNGKEKHWTQEDLAKALDIKVRMVKDMENKNKGLDSFSRRQLLCKLLDIPPALLGLASVDQIEKEIEKLKQLVDNETAVKNVLTSVPTIQRSNNDKYSLEAYGDLLQSYNQKQAQWTIISDLGEIEAIISALNRDSRNVQNSKEKRELLYILWEYHIISARSYLHDMHNIARASFHIDKALSIAEIELQDSNLLAISYEVLCLLHLIQRNVYLAKDSIDAAVAQLKNTNNIVKCSILGNAARVYQASARSIADTLTAKSYLGQSRTLIRNEKDLLDERYIPSTYNINRIKQTHFHALFSMKSVSDAMDVVDDMDRLTPQDNVRKKALYNLDRAKCYMVLEEYDQATMLLMDSLTNFKDIGLSSYIGRIKQLCQKLKNGPYGNSPDVLYLELTIGSYNVAKKG